MKKFFMAGLAALLPLTLTLLIIIFLVNLLTTPFENIVRPVLSYYGLFEHSFLFLTKEQVLFLSSKMLILLFIFAIILLVGTLARLVLVRMAIDLGDSIIHRIPIINTIYKSTQEVISTLFSSKSTTFSQVVLVPFPHAHTRSIGLITANQLPEGSDEKRRHLLSVFVPGTPNPAMGFILLFNRDQVIPLDIKVEEAFKLVVSCGVVFPESFIVKKVD